MERRDPDSLSEGHVSFHADLSQDEKAESRRRKKELRAIAKVTKKSLVQAPAAESRPH